MPEPPVLENLSAASTVLSPDRGRVATFDREGRWLYYFRRGETFKRSLASDVHLRFRQPMRQRRQLTGSEALALSAEVLRLATELEDRVSVEAQRRIRNEVRRWSPALLAAEASRFRSAYRPIAILPPDQYLAIVLQATEGCTWNGCTFCNFYMDRPFRMKTPVEFESHVDRVAGIMGAGLRLRRGVFLGDGNALVLSNDRLDPLLDVVATRFPGRDLFGFVDLYSGDRRTIDEWRHLVDRGLRRVYVGMETGLDELLAWVEKPGSAVELEGFVHTLKGAGLEVCLIVMTGMGGREYRRQHWRASRDLLVRLGLDTRDLIYLSPFVEHPQSRYHERRVAAGLTPMSPEEIEQDLDALAIELRQAGLKVSRYDIQEFVY